MARPQCDTPLVPVQNDDEKEGEGMMPLPGSLILYLQERKEKGGEGAGLRWSSFGFLVLYWQEKEDEGGRGGRGGGCDAPPWFSDFVPARKGGAL